MGRYSPQDLTFIFKLNGGNLQYQRIASMLLYIFISTMHCQALQHITLTNYYIRPHINTFSTASTHLHPQKQ